MDQIGLAGKSIENFTVVLLLQTFLMLAGARLLSYYQQPTLMGHIISFIVFSNFVVVVFIIKWLAKAEGTVRFHENNRSFMNNALNIMRSERHDYINHMQSILGLIIAGEHKEAINYLTDIGTECRFNNQIISVSNPSLRVLLENKRQAAMLKGIELKLTVQSHLETLNLTPNAITTVFGNLLDNAMDALHNSNDGNKKVIRFEIKETNEYYYFAVKDSGPPIAETVLRDIFQEGFSTKGTDRGFGLSLVKKTVEKYGGKIQYEQSPKGFIITLPKNEVSR